MITLLADSNALRHVGLKAYLQASRDHAVGLSDLTLVEMRKTKALQTSTRKPASREGLPLRHFLDRLGFTPAGLAAGLQTLAMGRT